MSERPEVHVGSAAELRGWLAANHDSFDGAWLVIWKKGTSGPYLAWGEIVDELLAFGWIDSTKRRYDDERSKLQVTPRKPASKWSRVNKEKVERLIAEDRMAPPGLAMVELAKSTGTWTALDDVDALTEPADLTAALDAEPAARGYWDAFPPSVRKAILTWITDAKRPATREKRIAETVELAAENLRASDWPKPTPSGRR